MQKVLTYTQMDKKIVGMLRYFDTPSTLYAAQRIEELEQQLETECQIAEKAEALLADAMDKLQAERQKRQTGDVLDVIEASVTPDALARICAASEEELDVIIANSSWLKGTASLGATST